MEMTVREGTPVRGVIFDKDGTLHDTERVFRRAWLAAGEEINVPDMEDTILHCTGMNLHDIGLYWAQKYPDIPFEPYIRLRNRIFDQLVAEGIPLRPGAMEVLHTLRARGYRLGLATSTNRTEATDHLRRTGMLELFDGLAFGDMVRDGKPAPDIYLLAARLIGLPGLRTHSTASAPSITRGCAPLWCRILSARRRISVRSCGRSVRALRIFRIY